MLVYEGDVTNHQRISGIFFPCEKKRADTNNAKTGLEQKHEPCWKGHSHGLRPALETMSIFGSNDHGSILNENKKSSGGGVAA